jgi:hypothetical protein
MTNETLQLIQAALQNPMVADPNKLAKIFAQATGLVQYDLQAPAKLIYPVLTPYRNATPRLPANGGTATHWMAITGINIANLSPGVGEGKRGGVIATTVVQRLAAYKTLGFEDLVTLQADWAAQGFDDPKARAVEGLLRSLMIGEEKIYYGGNASLQLGITPTPNVTASNSNGSLVGTGSVTYSVICVALTPEGYWNSSVAGGIPGQITRSSAIGEIDVYGGGNAQQSVNATGAVTSGTSGSLACTVAPVNGAVAYAWFWGLVGQEKLGAITTINSILITNNATGTQSPSVVAASDYSTNALIYDGFLTQSMLPGSGAYVANLATGTAGTGTSFTTNGQGGITEIDKAFAYFWDNYKLSPQYIDVARQEATSINKIVIANGGAPLIRFNLDARHADGTLDAGVVVGTLLNSATNTKVQVRIHPNGVPGTLRFHSDDISNYYKLSNVGEIHRFEYRSDYYQLEWPRRTNAYEYGIYADGALLDYFPPSGGVITNIAPA